MVRWFVIYAVGGALALMCGIPLAHAQVRPMTEDALTQRILDRIPDIPHTAPALGRGSERPVRARAHAEGILRASQTHADAWRNFAIRANWQHFQVERDLPALIAAMAMRESAFQSIVRLDDNTRVRQLPTVLEPIPARTATTSVRTRYRSRIQMADMGVMQVRAPSGPARACGVANLEDTRRLLTDLDFSYTVGTCILTNRLERYIDAYSAVRQQRFRAGQRPRADLVFYGVYGPRQGTADAGRARELAVIERYNWGGRDLYLHPVHGGYARRVLTEFEYFRRLDESGS